MFQLVLMNDKAIARIYKSNRLNKAFDHNYVRKCYINLMSNLIKEEPAAAKRIKGRILLATTDSI